MPSPLSRSLELELSSSSSLAFRSADGCRRSSCLRALTARAEVNLCPGFSRCRQQQHKLTASGLYICEPGSRQYCRAKLWEEESWQSHTRRMFSSRLLCALGVLSLLPGVMYLNLAPSLPKAPSRVCACRRLR